MEGRLMEWKEIQGERFRWINIDSPSADTINQLEAVHPFHRLALDDCLSKSQLPKINEYKDYFFIVLHIPRYLKDRKFSVPMQIAIFLGQDFLVTVHTGDLKPIGRIFEACNEESRRSEYMGNTPTYLLYRLILALADNLLLMAGKVMSNIEALELKVFDETVGAVREVTELRHDVANLRRIIFPLKRVLHELERKVQRFSSSESMEAYFGDLADTIDKVWEVIDACREVVEIYKDTDFIISSDRTNKILSVLTIVFTFSIPATVVGTFYGMNVKLPGAEDGLTFLGPHTMFYLIVTFSLICILLMVAVFRKVRWF